MSGDPYISVKATFKRRTEAAVQLDRDDLFEKVWIPRSCLHAASDDVVARATEGQLIELQMREWVASQKGLI